MKSTMMATSRWVTTKMTDDDNDDGNDYDDGDGDGTMVSGARHDGI